MNSIGQFEALVGEHYETLFRFAISLTRSDAEASDLTQQTFQIWANKGYQLRDMSRVRSWLFTTLHRAFLVSRRRQSRFIFHTLESASEDLPTVSPDFGGQTDGTHVVSALAKVDEVYRAAVVLFYLEDRSYREIGEILDVPIGTVKSRIARGIVQLRRSLGLADSRVLSLPGREDVTPTPSHDPGSLPVFLGAG
jgi:RNA polymerase sigma factor (sigma-70 family)